MSIKLSVIVPVYDTPKFYLENCLLNIHCQDYKNFECIIVCDGSPKNVVSICENYAKIDKRFKIFKQKNMGVSSARNLGISKAKGDYLYFIDSDDIIEPDFIKNIINIQDLNKNSLIQARTVTVSKIDDVKPKNVTSITKEFDVIKTYSHVVWTFLYDKRLIDKYKISFRNINHYEDALFNIEYFNVIDVDSVIKVPYRYIHLIRQNSISNQHSLERKAELKESLSVLESYTTSNLSVALKGKLLVLIQETKDML